MVIEVRTLEVEDIFAVARMLGKITKGARVELAGAIKGGKNKKIDPTELGMVLVQSLVIEAEEDLKAWLASLAGKEVTEFKTMPAIALLDVFEGLLQQEGIRDFFARASTLATKLTG